jgi:hypothetical protein
LATKTQSVELDPGNLTATFQGPGKTESDSVVVRGNVPISKACGIYYYEISIVSKGRDGYIGVGFTTLQTPSNKLPGNHLIIQVLKMDLGDIMLLMVKSLEDQVKRLVLMDQRILQGISSVVVSISQKKTLRLLETESCLDWLLKMLRP